MRRLSSLYSQTQIPEEITEGIEQEGIVSKVPWVSTDIPRKMRRVAAETMEETSVAEEVKEEQEEEVLIIEEITPTIMRTEVKTFDVIMGKRIRTDVCSVDISTIGHKTADGGNNVNIVLKWDT